MTSAMSRMSFEAAKYSVDRIMSLDRKVIEYKTRTVSKPIYADELVKNITMEMCYEATNTNPNSIYIPIKVCLEGYNKYKPVVVLYALEKDHYFLSSCGKKANNPLQVRIADNSVMSHNEVMEGLSIELGGVQCIIPVLWATNQPSRDMIIGNNFQRLYSPCIQTINQIIFTINSHSVPIKKLSKAYNHQKIEFARSQHGEKVMPAQ